MDNDMIPEHKLIGAARSGDVGAFEQLYRAYNDRIYNFARQIVGSEQDASDVAQETFIRAWQFLPKLRSEEAFKGWLYRIALSRSKEVLCRRVRNGEVSIDCGPDDDSAERQIASSADGPECQTLKREVDQVVCKAVSELSPDHRAVVAMHHLQEMDVSDVARILRVPQGTVLSRLARARAALKRKLAPYVEG